MLFEFIRRLNECVTRQSEIERQTSLPNGKAARIVTPPLEFCYSIRVSSAQSSPHFACACSQAARSSDRRKSNNAGPSSSSCSTESEQMCTAVSPFSGGGLARVAIVTPFPHRRRGVDRNYRSDICAGHRTKRNPATPRLILQAYRS